MIENACEDMFFFSRKNTWLVDAHLFVFFFVWLLRAKEGGLLKCENTASDQSDSHFPHFLCFQKSARNIAVIFLVGLPGFSGLCGTAL